MIKSVNISSFPSRNQPKSLSGIETVLQGTKGLATLAGINLNPYQGLKLLKAADCLPGDYAGINLNPYQGLKQC